ncbi:MAG: HD domain-containing phosphohydrolase [Vicinamibacterales bacterium]
MTQTRRPPRLLVKTLLVTFGTAALLLALVFIVVRQGVQTQVRRTQAQSLDVSQSIMQAMESGRLRELRVQAETLAENPTLKAAVDTYAAESSLTGGSSLPELLSTVQRELDKLVRRVDVDAVVLEDFNGRTLAAAGRMQGSWSNVRPHSRTVRDKALDDGELLEAGGALFRVVRVPLTLEDGATIGWLDLGNALDSRYAETLDQISHRRTAILHDGAVVATTLTAAQSTDFQQEVHARPAEAGTVRLAGRTFVFREIARVESARVYALGSVDDAVAEIMARFNLVLTVIAGGAVALALVGSVSLARLLTGPIARLSSAISERSAARDLTTPLPATGSSLELDSLTDTFNQLMSSVAEAEERTEAAYAGAIRALAATLDARDPYTAGHSERVSTLSVAVGQVLHLPDADIEVLRFGALLHDIGKIGIPDRVLLKPDRLTDEEFEIIMEHPVVGARILSSIPFLQPHIAIVELHHERPDGLGYPKGLRGDEIPLLARIVHVADAYDAITSARAYRQGRSSDEALRELSRCAGTEYHADIVSALVRALPRVAVPTAPLTTLESRAEGIDLAEARSA